MRKKDWLIGYIVCTLLFTIVSSLVSIIATFGEIVIYKMAGESEEEEEEPKNPMGFKI